MAVLNIQLAGRTIIPLLSRVSFDDSQLQMPADSDFTFLTIADLYEGYIYTRTAADMTDVTTWISGKGYTAGTPEDITPDSGVADWLIAREALGGIGTVTKDSIYIDLKIDFPAQVCVPAPA